MLDRRLPGDYSEDVVLKKHVALLGFDRLGHFTTIIRGQLTCDLTLEGGVREKTITTVAGLSIFPPSGKTAGVLFTGTSSQKLILTDVAIEGSVPALLADNIATPAPDKSARVILSCRSGVRSFKAAELLQSMGYENVASVAGGILEWQEVGLPVINLENATPAQFHIDWKAITGSDERVIQRSDYASPGNSRVWLYVERDWTPGLYRADLSINGQPAQQMEFSVY